ncbi:MAG: type II toxin-antitoxin system HicB family antitoxin [Lentisphaerota bacterium]
MMNYKGYTAKVEFDEEAEIFFGTVINTRDTITFQSENAHELKKEFELSVDDYLEFCKEQGKAPEKPYSGRFVLRVDPELHSKLHAEAILHHQSLNDFIQNQLQHALAR